MFYLEAAEKHIMIMAILGLLAMGFVLAMSLHGQDLAVYLNPHSLWIVLAGTAAVFMLSNPWRVYSELWRALKQSMGAGKLDNPLELFQELAATRTARSQQSDPLVQYAVEMWERGISGNDFAKLLRQKRADLEGQGAMAVKALKSLSKYPPALGMAGTVIAMVELFAGLGQGGGASIGPALSLAMTATFLGLMLSHAVIMPIADRLADASLRKRIDLKKKYEILMMVHEQSPVRLVMDEVKQRYEISQAS